jgi:uncharacterized repeat protein (TIGR01451 family)
LKGGLRLQRAVTADFLLACDFPGGATMSMSRYLSRTTAGFLPAALLLLAACGGGGGGGGGGTSSPVVYGGNTSAAVVTSTNASKLTENVIGSGDTAGIIGGVSNESGDAAKNQGSGLFDLARRLNRSLHDTVVRAGQANSAQRLVTGVIPVEQTDPCDSGSGSVRTFGTLNDNGTGTLQVSFNSCLIDGVTLSGPATLRVDAAQVTFSVVPTDFTLSFSRLMLRGSGLSIDAGGSVRTLLGNGNNTETITEDLVSLNNNTGKMTRSENLVFVNVYDNIFFPSSFTMTVTGRVLDQDHGFVDIATNAPLFFGTFNQLFPDSGQMLLTGDANRTIRVTALNSTLVQLQLDTNGDGTVDNTAGMKWTDLNGPVGADLGDTDNDGMHNSWEAANVLDPANPADAFLDKDNDGASNLAEYEASTDVSNPGSTPPPVGLAISSSDAPDPVTVGGNLTYTITVSNSSAFAANNVVVADTLPVGVNFVSATPGQGSCAGTTSLSCSVGTLNGFGNVVITIVVTPTAEGMVNNTAIVTSSSFDPDLTNNSATSITTVGQPAAGLQTLIDNAAPGDTVLVGPGLYVGGLNFNGKNITLQSSAGPGSTIIHGNLGTVVRIGPGGAIQGFTITGLSASFGAGIAVSGQGSLISGNVFDGTAQSASGLLVAIEGNNASPTIERNVFRNNSCDN